MSLIPIFLNLMVCLLLVCALAYGMRLERRLKAIRDGQAAFGKAVADLNIAAERARAGLAELRGATDESTDILGGRISRAREVADRLDRAIARAEALPEPAPAPQPQARPRAMGPEGGLSALLAQLREVESPVFAAPPPPEPSRREAPRVAARPASIDDDLFDDAGAFA